MSYQIYRFGSLYVNGEAQPEDRKKQKKLPEGESITLGDSVRDKAITWVRPDGMNILVAQKTLLVNISWNNLKRAGYVTHGVEVRIDGRDYLCRLLKVGETRDRDEWTEVLKRTTNLDSFWGWRKTGFWANKLWDNRSGIYYGTINVSDRLAASREDNYANVGFRPVLELKEPVAFGSGAVLSLEGHSFGLRQESLPKMKKATVSFQPMLYPILKGAPIQFIDRHMFVGITDLKAYTLLMDGKPVRQDTKRGQEYKPGAKLEVTDRFFGKKYLIQWRVQGCCAEAVRCMVRNVPYQALVDQGLAVPMKEE